MSAMATRGAAMLLFLIRSCVADILCPAGQGIVPGMNMCGLCAAGRWSNASSTACTKCAPGTWSGIIGATEAAVCVPCPPGHWNDEAGSAWPYSCRACDVGRYGIGEGLASEDACEVCPAGTFSGAQGATTWATCSKCPAGRYGDEPAAEDLGSCTLCPAGHWSSLEGAPSIFHCEECPAGTWGEEAGANSKANCTLCPAGRWSGLPGQSDRSVCAACPAGRWSAELGASGEAACVPCPTGTWSSEPAADNPFVCQDCPVGKAQPRLGESSEARCLECSPGNYTSSPGSSACARCPRGSWANAPAQAWCHACPAGKWTHVAGAVFYQRCAACTGDLYCLGGSTAHVEVRFPGLNFSGLARHNRSRVVSAYASRIAGACEVDPRAVMDLYGGGASVTLSETGLVEAYVTVPMNSSINAMVSNVYTEPFEKVMREATAMTVGSAPNMFYVNVQPKLFKALLRPTTTTLTSTTTTATLTASTTTTTTAVGALLAARHRGSFPWWAWLSIVSTTVLLIVFGLAVYLLRSHERVRAMLAHTEMPKRRTTRAARLSKIEQGPSARTEQEPLVPSVAAQAAMPAGAERASPAGVLRLPSQPRTAGTPSSPPALVVVAARPVPVQAHLPAQRVFVQPWSRRTQQAPLLQGERAGLLRGGAAAPEEQP